MKKVILPLLCSLVALISFSACTPLDTTVSDFDETDLYGKWQENTTTTLYYIYYSDGTGKTWDTADDVTEDEAQPFTWELSSNDFLHIYIGEMGEKVPKEYTMIALTSTAMTYSDSYKSWSFHKI